MDPDESPLKGVSPESSIISNVVFCFTVGIPLFTIFCLIRGRFRSVYAPNVLNAKK